MMKKKELIIEIICLLFILLFIYASVSKLLDYSQFELQLHKSPMLVGISDYIAWLVPFVEIVISILLVFSSTRRLGLYASITLMVLFTFYIIAILNYSEYIPCSCGGILQQLGWKDHLIFNVFFCCLALIAINLESAKKTSSYLITSVIIIFSVVSMTVLFKMTYNSKDKYSSFDKKSFESEIGVKDSIDLGYNSYYFAGTGDGKLYLANSTALQILVTVDPESLKRTVLKIDSRHPLSQYAKASVIGDHFYLTDGTIPKILEGNTRDLIARESTLTYSYFNDFVPINSTTYALRVQDRSGNYSLGLTKSFSGFLLKSNLLTKQIDGRFCVDGMYHFNSETMKLIYVYFYRNQFLIMDTLMDKSIRGKTIDSISTARIKISTMKQGDHITSIVIPELVVNRQSFSCSNYLFIRSNIKAKNETLDYFEKHPRLDVYSISAGHYIGSFNFPLKGNIVPRQFFGFQNQLYTLSDNYLIRYDLTKLLEECRALTIDRNFTGQ